MKDAGAALVLVTTSFPIRGDGSEAAGSFVSDLAEELAQEGQIRVVAPGATRTRERWSDGVDVFRYAAPDRPLSTLVPWKPHDLLTIARVLSAGAEATNAAVSAGPTSHVLALWALPSGHWARNAWLKTRTPYSIWTLGSDIWSLGRIPILRSYLRSVLSQAAFCYSDGIQLAKDTEAIAGRSVTFLPSTRRIARARGTSLGAEPPYRLLFLGRWHPNKGVDLLLDSLALLDDRDWDRISTVQVCGGGPLDPLVRAGAHRLVKAGRPVDLQGYLDKGAAEAAIAEADYVLIPSRIESIPLIFSDAVKLGSPVISMPVGDLPDLIGKAPAAGVVAKEVSALAFKTAISTALSIPPESFSRGIERAANLFDISGVARLINTTLVRELYERLRGGHDQRRNCRIGRSGEGSREAIQPKSTRWKNSRLRHQPGFGKY